MKADFPEKLSFLFEPARYKVLYGGRGGAKSWGIARALLLLGYQKPLRILCTRETQKSIADSVHKLLSDQITSLGLDAHYTIQQASIFGQNGTEFIFAGIRQNISNLKSYESVDICWVEEAQTVSKNSWDVLVPTIRKDGSEIWLSFNPELDTDETYKRFVLSPPSSAKVVKVNYSDNPWFPSVLRDEMEDCRRKSEDDYAHIWEGMCRQTVEGAIYASEMRAVDQQGRIRRVPYDPVRPVVTFWDLGIGDETAIWFAQAVGGEYHLIDYLEGSGQRIGYYLQEVQRRGYVYAMHYLPHDAAAKELGTGKSIEELVRTSGFKTYILPRLSIEDGINAARTVFPQCWFDGEKCADGIQALRHYRWAPINAHGERRAQPLHDHASNGADAFRYFALGIKPGSYTPPLQQSHPAVVEYNRSSYTSWS